MPETAARRRTTGVLAGVSALVLLVSACSSSGASPGDNGSGGSQAPKQLTIGASVLGLEFPAVVALVKGLKEQASDMGVTLKVDDAGGQASKQTNDMRDLITQHVDGIIVNAIDSKSIVSSADAALAANVPLASAFTTLGSAECAYPGSVAHAGFDEQGWATLQGKEAVKLLPAGGDVAIIDGLAGLQSSKIRHDAFVAQLQPDLKVVATQPGDFDRTKARTAMTNILQANPDLKLVYAPDDNMAVGAIQAIQAAGRKAGTDGIMVLSVGGSKDGLTAVQAGTLSATVFSSLETGGRDVMKAMVDRLRGTDTTMGQCLNLPQTLVDSANIAQFAGKGEY